MFLDLLRFLTVTETVLWRKGKLPNIQEDCNLFSCSQSIKDRPEELEDCEVFGGLGSKCNGFSRGESKVYLAIFVERKTRFSVAIKMKGRIKDSIFSVISSLYNIVTSKLLKTFTVDHGKEFACYKQVKLSLEYQCIWWMRMQHGNVVLTKIATVCFMNFS